jgi:hypothetical protein
MVIVRYLTNVLIASVLSTMHTIFFILSDGGKIVEFNATFNTISVISWRSVLFLEETLKVPGENH